MTPPSSKLEPYRAALQAIANRTKTPLPSLIASFAILHELTAVFPLVSVFLIARSLGIGEYAVNFVRREISEAKDDSWVRGKGAQWLDEGEQWTARVGKRYGVFGFSKTPKNNQDETSVEYDSGTPSGVAGDVANAILAYGVTKVRDCLGKRLNIESSFSHI
jgi:hypothetical protein